MKPLVALWLSLLPAAWAVAGPGAVDWEKKVVKCTGSGAANLRDAQGNKAVARIGAERAAKLDAIRSCLEAVKGVRIHGDQTVGAAIAGDASVRSRVEGVVRGFRVVGSPRYFEDGGVEMDVEVPLDGVAEVVVPGASPGSRPAAPPAGAQAPAAPRLAETGLLIDAKGTGLQPGLAPRVMDDLGREIYGLGSVAPESRRTMGAAAYARDLDAARKTHADRVGDRPRVVKAVKAAGTDVVLSDPDAESLRRSPPPFLAEGRVVIVTD